MPVKNAYGLKWNSPLGIVGIVVGIALAVYGIGFAWFSFHALPNTVVDGTDISGMTADQAVSAIEKDSESWQVRISGDGYEHVLSPSESGISADVAGDVAKSFEEPRASWPAAFFASEPSEIDNRSLDAVKTQESIAGSVDEANAERKMPSDARIELAEDRGSFKIVPDEPGTMLDLAALTASACASVDNGELDVAIGDAELVQPAVTADNEDLNRRLADANRMLGASITYEIDKVPNALTVDKERIAGWIRVDGEEGVYVDRDAVKAFLAEIGMEWDTAGKDRPLVLSQGVEIPCIGSHYQGGNVGWITDETAEIDPLIADIVAGNKVERVFPTKQQAPGPKGTGEMGDTYIDIDLTAQHLWYVKGGEIVLDFGIISGKNGYSTPAMISQVWSKGENLVLVSPWKDASGQPTYKTPVALWVGVSVDGNIGVHDAAWQPVYGYSDPSYHFWGGSHGCCNVSYENCRALYDMVEEGTPAILHY
jgi:hypothetical protein